MSHFRFYRWLTAPITLVFAARTIRPGQFVQHPPWLEYAPWIFAAAVLYSLVNAAYFRHIFHTRLKATLSAKGKDPHKFILSIGSALLTLPTIMGFAFTQFGAEMAYVYLGGVISVVGILVWGRMYSEFIGQKKGAREPQGAHADSLSD